MKKIKDKNLPPGSQLLLPVLLILLILTGGNTLAQNKQTKKETKKKEVEFDVNVGLNTFYDDNILKYSDKYLERFMNNQDQGRFHIETYDDVVLSPSLKLASTYPLFGKMNTRVNADFLYNHYIVNDVKNWSSFTLGIQQFITKKASFKLSYSYIPEFYVRHFRDEDWVDVLGYVPETFVPYSFAKENYGIWAQNTFFKNTRIRGSINYALYYHNEHYTEYDCKNWVFGLTLYQPLHKKVRMELGWEFTTSDAKGYDEPFETRETSDDADATYEEDVFMLAITWQLPKMLKKNHDINFDGEYLKRYYTTNNYLEEDPEHAGRVDDAWRCFFTYSISLSKSFEASAFYKWYGRNTSSESEFNELYLAAEKDFRQNQYGIGVSYTFDYK